MFSGGGPTGTDPPGGSNSGAKSVQGQYENVNLDENEVRITTIDKKFWIGKTSVKLADIERSHDDLIRFEEAVNRSFRILNRSLNQKVAWVNTVVTNSNSNFEILKTQLETLVERVDQLEDRGRTESRNTRSRSAGSRASSRSRRGREQQQQQQQLPLGNLSMNDELAEVDAPLIYGINMLSSAVSPNLEFFGEESAFAFDDWSERFKDHVSVSGKNWNEEEKVTRLKMALKDTPRSLFKELPAAETVSLDTALKALRAKLDSPQRREVAKRTLAICKQREEESVAQFLRRLTPLVESTNPSLNAAQRKEKVCEEFLDRLKPNMSFLIRLVGLTKTKDLDMVKAQAEELEALLLSNKGEDLGRLSLAVNALRDQPQQAQVGNSAGTQQGGNGNAGQNSNMWSFRPFTAEDNRRQNLSGSNRTPLRNWGRNQQQQQQRFSQRNWTSSPFCTYCRRTGHTAFACRERRARFQQGGNRWDDRRNNWQRQEPRTVTRNQVNTVDQSNSSSTSQVFLEELVKSLVNMNMRNSAPAMTRDEDPKNGGMNSIMPIEPKNESNLPNDLVGEAESKESPKQVEEESAHEQSVKQVQAKTSNWERIGLGAIMHISFVTIMFLSLMMASVNGRSVRPSHPLLCQNQKEGKVWQLPEVSGCSATPLDHTRTPVSRTLRVFSPNVFEHDVEAWGCRKVFKAILKSTSITNVNLTQKLEPITEEISPAECRQMIEHKTCSLGSLIDDSGVYHTNRKIDTTPRMWFVGSFGWKQADSHNCYLFKTRVSVNHGESFVRTPLIPTTTNCAFQDGLCKLEDNTLLIWEHNATRMCEYTFIDVFEGIQLGEVWVSDEASLRLTFSNSTRKVYSCGVGLQQSEEGFAVRDIALNGRGRRMKRSTRGLVTESELNAKLGYLDDKVMDMMRVSFAHAIKSICDYMVETRRWAASALLADPTDFARTMFRNGNLVAKQVGHGLMKVWPCADLKEGQYKFVATGENQTGKVDCFDMVPITFGLRGSEQFAFVDPRTMMINPSARKAPCGEYRKQLLFINGTLIEVDHVTGRTKLAEVGRIEKIGVPVPDPPRFYPHSFHHMITFNVSDLLGHVYDANFERVSEITYGIRKSDEVMTRSLSDEWREVRDEVEDAIWGDWFQVGRIVFVVMVVIVFADFLVRFGLMLRDEYRGRGVSRRMAFGPNDVETAQNAQTEPTRPEEIQSTQESVVKMEFHPIKLITPMEALRRSRRARRQRKSRASAIGNVTTAMTILAVIVVQLNIVAATPEIPTRSNEQERTPNYIIIFMLCWCILTLILIRVLMTARLIRVPFWMRFGMHHDDTIRNLPMGSAETNERELRSRVGENLEGYFRRFFGLNWASERLVDANIELGIRLITDSVLQRIENPHNEIDFQSLRMEEGSPVVRAYDFGHDVYHSIRTNDVELVFVERENGSSTARPLAQEPLPDYLQLADVWPEEWLPTWQGENLEAYFRENYARNWAEESFDDAYTDLGFLLFTDFCLCRVAAPHEMLSFKGMQISSENTVLPVVVYEGDNGQREGDNGQRSTIWTGEVELVNLTLYSLRHDQESDVPIEHGSTSEGGMNGTVEAEQVSQIRKQALIRRRWRQVRHETHQENLRLRKIKKRVIGRCRDPEKHARNDNHDDDEQPPNKRCTFMNWTTVTRSFNPGSTTSFPCASEEPMEYTPCRPASINSISPHSVVITTNVNTIPVRCLLDTGASLTVAPRSIASKLLCRLNPYNLEAMSASGHVIRLTECARVSLEIAGTRILATINFVDDSEFTVSRDYSIIIGGDVFERLPPISFDYGNKIFTVGGNKVRFGQRSYVLTNDVRIVACEDVMVPVDTQMLIKAQTETFPPLRNSVVVDRADSSITRIGMAVINSVSPVGAGEMMVAVVNPTMEPKRLWKGMHLAIGNEVECDETGLLREECARELLTVQNKSGIIVDPTFAVDFSKSAVKGKELEELKGVINEFSDVFSKSQYDLGMFSAAEHHITTTTEEPVSSLPRRTPYKYREELKKHIEQLLASGVMVESDTPWVTPIVIVQKKDGGIRPCLDFRKLNDVTIPDRYPLPRLDSIMGRFILYVTGFGERVLADQAE